MPLRRLHGRINDWWINYKDKCAFDRFVQRAIINSKKEKKDKLDNPDFKIDFVVTWVDGNDPNWLLEKVQYTSSNSNQNINNDISRYREWDIFQFWFRAVERNAPWVNKVYLVTCGHTPDWLNIYCPKLRIIKHEDIIPKEYLPTFNSHTIEWFLWKIPGLSEHFVYFNDDVFITRPLKKDDFFSRGLPKYCAIAKPIVTFINMNAHRHARFNSVGLINSVFDISRCILQQPQKWFNYQYKNDVKYNIRAYEDGLISGIVYNHLGIPFRKSAMEEFCQQYPEQINKTCMHRIRSSDDIMHQAVQMWEMFHGNFEPVGENYYGRLFFMNKENVEVVEEEVEDEKNRMICINDHEYLTDEDFSSVQKRVKKALEKKYSAKSDFEI